MNDIQQMIQRAGHIEATLEHMQSRGQPAPPSLVQELDRIMSRGQAMLTPGEQQMALRAVDSLKAQYHDAWGKQEAVQAAHEKQYHMDQLSQDLTGLNYDQMMSVKHTGQYAVQAPKHIMPERLEAVVKDATKAAGKEMTPAQFTKMVDRYNELSSMRGEEPARQYLADTFGKGAPQALQFMESWENSGMDIKWGLQQRRQERGEEYKDQLVEASDEQRRRVDIADAWAHTAAADHHSRESLIDSYDEEALAEDSRVGDLHRAFAKHDGLEMEESIRGYQPPSYNEEHLQESADELSANG